MRRNWKSVNCKNCNKQITITWRNKKSLFCNSVCRKEYQKERKKQEQKREKLLKTLKIMYKQWYYLWCKSQLIPKQKIIKIKRPCS